LSSSSSSSSVFVDSGIFAYAISKGLFGILERALTTVYNAGDEGSFRRTARLLVHSVPARATLSQAFRTPEVASLVRFLGTVTGDCMSDARQLRAFIEQQGTPPPR
jgi:hypothetical protein